MSLSSNFPTVRPNLVLDFAGSRKLDPRITFTRAATAVYYDGVTTAKAEENLLTYSQEFDNADWAKTNSTVTANATTSPDGTVTAEKIVSNASATDGRVQQTKTVSGSVVFSVFAKASEWGWVLLGPVGSTVGVYFDLSTGALGNQSGGYVGTITSAGNGWYRCSVAYTGTGTSQTVRIYPTNANGSVSTGNGTSGIFLWGAQLEQRDAVTAYTPTTTTAITNYIPKLQTAASGEPRFDCNPTTAESLGLLVEEARTNLLTYSQAFDDASWSKTRVNLTTAAGVAPDGTLTAARLYEDTTANATHLLIKGFSAAASTTYTFSVYLKAAGRNYANIQIGNFANQVASNPIYVNLSTGVIETASDFTRCSISSVGNGWYRVSVTVTTIASAVTISPSVYVTQSNNNQAVVTADGYSGVLIWGAQLEAGAFATSYIPTVASQVTRAADVASVTGVNFSSWFKDSGWTMYAEYSGLASGSASGIGDNQYVWGVNNSSASGYDGYGVRDSLNSASLRPIILGRSGAVVPSASVNYGAYRVAGQFYKSAAAVDSSQLAITADQKAVFESANTVYWQRSFNQLLIGFADIGGVGSFYLNGTIKKLAYYPVRLPNAQLQALTK